MAKKEGNGISTIPFAMSPPGFEPGTPRLKVVRFFIFPGLTKIEMPYLCGFPVVFPSGI